jgi:hypothetical protein
MSNNIKNKIRENNRTKVNTVTAYARLRPRVWRDEDSGESSEVTVEVNIYIVNTLNKTNQVGYTNTNYVKAKPSLVILNTSGIFARYYSGFGGQITIIF